MYDIKSRQIVLNVYFKLKSLRKTEYITNISRSTISRWNAKINIPLIVSIVQSIFLTNNFFTINDLKLYLQTKHNINISRSLIGNIMKKEMKLQSNFSKLDT